MESIYLNHKGLYMFSSDTKYLLNLDLSTKPPPTQAHETEIIVDSGASLHIGSQETIQFLPEHRYKLQQPVVLQQGKGTITLDRIGLVPRFVASPDDPRKAYVMLLPTMAAPLDRNTTIVSSTQLARFGLGTLISPGNRKQHELFNEKGNVHIPLHTRAAGLPFFKDIGPDHAKKLTLYDAFTGKKFDKRLATARAMHRFVRAFIEEGKGRLVRRRDSKPSTSKILNTSAELHNLVHELETSWAKSCREGKQCLRFHQNEVVHEFEDSSEEDFLEAGDHGFPTL